MGEKNNDVKKGTDPAETRREADRLAKIAKAAGELATKNANKR